jgi:hypothetical protein
VFQTDEPDADNHPEELKKGVHEVGAKDGAGGRDGEAPTAALEVVSSYAEGAGVRPSDPRRLPDGDLVHGDASVGLLEEL